MTRHVWVCRRFSVEDAALQRADEKAVLIDGSDGVGVIADGRHASFSVDSDVSRWECRGPVRCHRQRFRESEKQHDSRAVTVLASMPMCVTPLGAEIAE